MHTEEQQPLVAIQISEKWMREKVTPQIGLGFGGDGRARRRRG
jgi:hypothetical protein